MAPLPSEAFELVYRGLDLAWAGAIPNVAVQAMWARGHRDAALQLLSFLDPGERLARFGWTRDAPAASERRLTAWSGDDELAIAGFEAGRAEPARVDELVAALDASEPEAISAVLVSACLSAREIAGSWRAGLVPPKLALPQLVAELRAYSYEESSLWTRDWTAHVGAAAHDARAASSVDEVLAGLLEVASTTAASYARDLARRRDAIDPGDPDRVRARDQVTTFLRETAGPASAAPGSRPRGVDRQKQIQKLSRRATLLAELGELDLARAALDRACEVMGPIDRWGQADRTGRRWWEWDKVALLAAAGHACDALAVAPDMSADLRVLTVAGLAREGALEQARSELERLVARSPRLRSQDQLPSRYLTSDDHIALSEDALGPRHLTKLAPVLERLDPSGMARAVAEIAAAANALPTSLTTLARFATADVN